MSIPSISVRRPVSVWMLFLAIVLLGVVYVLVIGPTSLVTQLARRDFLAKRGLRAPGSAWLAGDTSVPDLERSSHPF